MDHLDVTPPLTELVAEPAFELRRPDQGGVPELQTPLIFASPHSGRFYPRDLLAASVLGAAAIRRSEDAFVDGLIEMAPTFGATVINARYARAYMDVNREPYELDPAMFEDELPLFARAQTPRVAAGLGAIARVVAEGQEIYGRKLSFAEAKLRIDQVHRPYHAALVQLLATAKAQFGLALLIDWHSMPSAVTRGTRGRPLPDFVLGDCFGASCAPALRNLVERELTGCGYAVARNTPFAGGYTTQFYGGPETHVHVLQIEINRALYLDEAALTPAPGFARLKADLERLFASLQRHWRRLI